MRKNDSRGQSFEASLSALEKIVRDLERGDLPLEESLALFEDGVRLSRECQERLNSAERRIEVLLRGNDGAPVVETLGAAAGEKENASEEDNDDIRIDEGVF